MLSDRQIQLTGVTYWHLCEVSSEHTRDVVRCVVLLLPIEVLSVLRVVLMSNKLASYDKHTYSGWRLERSL